MYFINENYIITTNHFDEKLERALSFDKLPFTVQTTTEFETRDGKRGFAEALHTLEIWQVVLEA